MVKHHKILIFASGSGTNAEQIIRHFSSKPSVEVLGVYSNNPSAFVLERAKQLDVSTHVFNREQFNNPADLLKDLQAQSPDLIVLAGFLWKIPTHIIDAFPNKIINIHPALLPKYGGKGMYGHHIHQAVIDAKETESGISIHYVNNQYDQGAIIFQAKTMINPDEDPDSLAQKIHKLEHRHFSEEIEKLLLVGHKQVNLYTDGAASGNPGPGGYGLILEWEGTPHKRYTLRALFTQPTTEWSLGLSLKDFKCLKNPHLMLSYIQTRSTSVRQLIKSGCLAGKKKGLKTKKTQIFGLNF